MKPKEKAQELIVKSLVQFEKLTINEAKKIALIAVDEVLNLDLHDVGDYKDFDTPSEWYISYWEEVKQEIEKL
jgi:preprotein translocase subunit SecE